MNAATQSNSSPSLTPLADYFAGHKLYGDDFSPHEIAEWFEDEVEGFADLGAKNRDSYAYEYHGLNRLHGFSHLPPRNYGHILSIGGAYGEELKPLSSSINAITILEPSGAFVGATLNGIPLRYVKPLPSGTMPFDADTFDLATCFGCLHHIPNVSKILQELYRCLKPNGFALVREPIISLGDWSTTRQGLTKRERGIPLSIFRQLISQAGFTIERETLCCFPLTPRVGRMIGTLAYNSITAVRIDQLLACLFAWNYRYHPVLPHHKVLPTAAAYVLHKT